MGVGKSTIGPALAQRLGRPFADSDAEVERRAGKSVAQIFADEGEAAFRALEASVVDEFARGEPVVAALGGGAIAPPGTAEKLARCATVVYLRASPDQLLHRIGSSASTRPLLQGLDHEGRLARLRQVAAEREASYLTARVVVETDGETIAQVVSRVARRVEELEAAAASDTSASESGSEV